MKLTLMMLALLLGACAQSPKQAVSTQPVKVLKTVYYDGKPDDLLTAGLGLSGLRGPAPELPAEPTAAELRRASYYHQFKALNDLTDAGGMGRLYGLKDSQEPIAGHEFWSQRLVANQVHHTVLLQVPDHFDPQRACLVVAPSSGSRNVLGAVGTSGAWALIKGCAVVYTDKGTGTAVALAGGQQYRIDGLIGSADDELAAATALQPASQYHVVQKHPYSQAHPEKYWGQLVLDAADYGLALLAQHHSLNRSQVKVMAASVSNGGGAVLRAAEADQQGLLDAVVAAEPQVNLRHQYQLHATETLQDITTQPLLALSIQLSVFEPCAMLADSLATAPFTFNTVLIQPLLKDRCEALKSLGLLHGDDIPALAADALAKIKAIHIEPAALPLVPINTLANMWATINHTYTNSYLRQTAADNLCQSAMSAFTAQGSPRELTQQELTQMFALSNGIAPSHGIELAHTDTNNQIQSKMMLAEQYGLASQHCFYQLLTTESLQQAMAEVLATPAKNQLPTLILHGQADGTVAINHASRAYYHQNQSSDQANPNMRYIEIDHAQHFDAFLPYPGFNDRFVPMHPYFEQALERMYNHLMFGQALPPSQRIATMPRGNVQGAVPELSDLHIPPIIDQPTHPIRVIQNQLVIE